MSMNLRHAAALALVGWYLILLPKDDIQLFDIPWSVTQRSFDTAKECEEARAKAVVPAPEVSRRPIATPTPPASTGWFGNSEPTASETPKEKPSERAFFCVATDDPRLKVQ
jgi:hypothetical protein